MAGATPKLTTSARLSSCLPISELAFNKSCNKAIKKSMTAAIAPCKQMPNIFFQVLIKASPSSLTVDTKPF